MTLLEQIAQQHTNAVIYSSISVTIEKIATEAAQDILRDPDFRAELKQLARQAARRAVRDLQKVPRPRRRKAAR